MYTHRWNVCTMLRALLLRRPGRTLVAIFFGLSGLPLSVLCSLPERTPSFRGMVSVQKMHFLACAVTGDIDMKAMYLCDTPKTRAHSHTHAAHMRALINTCIHAYILTICRQIHTYIHTYNMQEYIYTYIHTRTQHLHAYTNTNICIQLQGYLSLQRPPWNRPLLCTCLPPCTWRQHPCYARIWREKLLLTVS